MNKKLNNSLKGSIRDQKGAALILALILLAIGSLMLVPLLSFMGSGFKTTDQVYDQKADELYAADAGVRTAILKIQDGTELPTLGDPPQSYPEDDFTIKNIPVNYTIEAINPIPLGVAAAYRIVSIADNTTVTADAVMIDFSKVFTRNVVTSPNDASIKNNVNFSGPVQAGGFDLNGDGIVDDTVKPDAIDGFICSILIPPNDHDFSYGGHDYTNPEVVIKQPGSSGATGASGTAVMEGGVIKSVLMNSGGGDYIGPMVVFTDSAGYGKHAGATAVVRDNVIVNGTGPAQNGVIVDIILTDGGYGYSASTLSVTIEGGNPNSVATLDKNNITIDPITGEITSINFSSDITVTPGTPNNTYDVDYVTGNEGGSGYKYPSVEIKDGAGITAKAKAVLGDKGTIYEGKVVSIVSVVAGTGYRLTEPHNVHIDPPPAGGIQATAEVVIDEFGGISAYTVTNPGSGYKKAPNVVVDPSPPGPGHGALPVATVMNTRVINSSMVSQIWPSAGSGSNPLQVFYMEQLAALGIDDSPLSGGSINLGSITGPTYIVGDVTFTTSSTTVPTILPDTADNVPRLIYVNGTVTFENCNVNLNGYTIFSTSTADATDPVDMTTIRAINVRNSAEVEGPGAFIAVGGINFQPKGNNTQYTYVMSLNGKVRLAPMNDFVGSVAAPEVVVQSGNGANVTWADPSQLDPPLNLPGGETTSLIPAGFISWIIN